MRSTSILWGFIAWTMAACGGHPPDAGDPSGPGGAAGSGGDAGSGGAGTGKGAGGSGGGGTSPAGGSSGAGGSPQPPDDAGPPGTQPSCASLVGMLNVQGWIAFDSDHDNFHRNLYMMHPDRSGLVQLTTGLNNDREPFFSPDGKQISFTSNVNGLPQIFVMDVATRRSVKLTNQLEGADESSFSRDGQWIAFHSGDAVYIIKIDGTGEKRVSASGAAGTNAYHWPAFSAAGTELVFDRYNEIKATQLDGTGLRYIVGNTTAQIKSPAVSPDGADVAYQGGCFTESGIVSIWTTPFATQTQLCMGRRVTPPDGREAKNPAWVTSAAIAYERVDRSNNLGAIAIISRALNSSPCILTPAPDDSRNPTWFSP